MAVIERKFPSLQPSTLKKKKKKNKAEKVLNNLRAKLPSQGTDRCMLYFANKWLYKIKLRTNSYAQNIIYEVLNGQIDS